MVTCPTYGHFSSVDAHRDPSSTHEKQRVLSGVLRREDVFRLESPHFPHRKKPLREDKVSVGYRLSGKDLEKAPAPISSFKAFEHPRPNAAS
jgi:hypothetical protein